VTEVHRRARAKRAGRRAQARGVRRARVAGSGAPISKFVAVGVTTEPELGDAPELTSASGAGADRAGVTPTSMCGAMAIPLGTARKSYDAIGSALAAESSSLHLWPRSNAGAFVTLRVARSISISHRVVTASTTAPQCPRHPCTRACPQHRAFSQAQVHCLPHP
jgi:hypothetical protein